MADTHLLNCYHKGCGKDYDPAHNTNDSCKYHPGGPIFHDALKGWSCCKKRSCDFTEFLNIPGCTSGCHSSEKPAPPESQAPQQNTNSDPFEMTVRAPQEKIERQIAKRPSENEPLTPLKATVGASLKTALEKTFKELDINGEKEKTEGVCTEVKPGTICHNKACQKSFVDESSNLQTCVHHPGGPVFHEGMKYWSCCQRKTTEFDNFLAQEGCASGKHCWFKKDESKTVTCRIDWHQTAQFVTISVFAKVAVPETTVVDANKVTVNMNITFEGGKSAFEKRIVLRGVVDPERSGVKLLGTKVEINLRKAEPGSWPTLEMPRTEPTPSDPEVDDANDLSGL